MDACPALFLDGLVAKRLGRTSQRKELWQRFLAQLIGTRAPEVDYSGELSRRQRNAAPLPPACSPDYDAVRVTLTALQSSGMPAVAGGGASMSPVAFWPAATPLMNPDPDCSRAPEASSHSTVTA